jgi:hypothetical protein
MKNTLKFVLTPTLSVLGQAKLWIQIRTLEAKMSGRDELFVMFTDRITLANMDNAQIVAACELRRLKREYMNRSRPQLTG